MHGPPLASPELWVPIGRRVASGGATLDFAWTYDFEEVIFHFSNIVPATNDDILAGRTSSDGGSSFDAGASDYERNSFNFDSAAALNFSTADDRMFIAGHTTTNRGISNGSGYGCCGTIQLFRPFDTGQRTRFYGTFGHRNGGSGVNTGACSGARLATGRVDAFRFFMDSGGNISEGTIEAWGVLPIERAA